MHILLFLNNDNEYENGVTFNDFHLCYKYDTRLKNILFKYIILIEQSLKQTYHQLSLKTTEYKSQLKNHI